MFKKFLLAFAMLCTLSNVQAQDIAGIVYVGSQCASGGFDYYFFEDNTFVANCIGCEASHYVQTGTWKIVGMEVVAQIENSWIGKGQGAIIPPCGSVCIYERYTAVKETKPNEERFELSYFEEPKTGEADECGPWYFNPEELKNDPQQFLRLRDFNGKYPQGSTRLLTTADFKGLTKADLKIMRNEIFARYGYIFKTKEMADYFKKQSGYYARLENVDAFLSEIELKNVALIKKYEGL